MTRLFYPKRNVIGIEPVFEPRRLKQIRTIDLTKNPLPISDYLRRPLIRRGRWLVVAFDLNLKKHRSFYRNAFQHEFHEPPLRIGQRYESAIKPVSREFPATIEARRDLAMILHRLKRNKNLFVYADDLKILRPTP